MEDIKFLPEGQLRAVVGPVGGDSARTYKEASGIAGTSVNTLYTHLRRVKSNYPKLYGAICKERKAQLRARHREALARAGSIRNSTSGVFVRVSGGGLAGYFGILRPMDL